jgi:hypothetical protein
MNKFQINLTASNKEIKQKRAEHVAATAAVAATQKLSQLQLEKQGIELQISDLVDLSPTRTTNLNVGEKFDANAWINELHQLRTKLHLKEVDIKILQQIIDEWFTESTTVTTPADE